MAATTDSRARTTEQDRLEHLVTRLAAIERGSASPGERAAAELVADALREAGLEPVLEEERVHGTHWLPFGLPPAAAALAAVAGGRLAALVTGAAAAASVAEDIGGGPQLLRGALPQRTTTNVVARLGDPDARHHLLVCAHHDAARGGLAFHPRLAPRLVHGSTRRAFAPVIGGPALVALGGLLGSRILRKAGAAVSGASAAMFADAALRKPVPGANDNATGVAAMVAAAARLRADPPPDLAITFLSTGSEETWLEGMAAFGRRHFSELPPYRTTVVCLDSIGWPRLVLLRDEGVWTRHHTPRDVIRVFRATAKELDIRLAKRFPGAFPTDGLITRRAGYLTLTVLSTDHANRIPEYHTRADVPEHVHWDSVLDATRLVDAFARRLT